jgi:hypothetical protein
MSTVETFAPLVKSKIETLRPKLLELSTKNPLLSTKFSGRGMSYIRVVDELPDILAERLSNGKMRLQPLPPLDQELKDEQTQEFQNALAEAVLNDLDYQTELEELALATENEPQKQTEIERQLKDRVREQLGLPPRVNQANISLEQHARHHNISPHFDLPYPESTTSKDEHQDDNIQTLMLSDSLQRHLDKIASKCEESLQETGVNILYAAFGFLEWSEQVGSKNHLAPILLLPLTMDKTLTNKGSEFWIMGNGETVELNPVLVEKFQQEFGIILPSLEEDETPESYFSRLSDIAINGQACRIKRQIAIGIFPSTTLAMYKDLDTNELGENGFDLLEHPVLQDLFCKMGGSDSLTIYADDYHIDTPEIEAKVPLLVTQADASQFSVLADLASGKNLSVEGPPGTGKSQTIVNSIAVALEQGKKVLFIAEKSAALEVVKNRLEAFGLGEFLLPLHSTRSNKAEVISSIKSRLELTAQKTPHEYEHLQKSFRQARQEINDYLELITQSFGSTGLTIHDIIWKYISKRHRCEGLPDALLDSLVQDVTSKSKTEISDLKQLCERFYMVWQHAAGCNQYWRYSSLLDSDPLLIERTLQAAKQAGEKAEALHHERSQLQVLKLSPDTTLEQLEYLLSTIETLGKVDELSAILLAKRLSTPESLAEVKAFLKSAEDTQALRKKLKGTLKDPNQTKLVQHLEALTQLLKSCEVASLSEDALRDRLTQLKTALTEQKELAKHLRALQQNQAPIEDLSLSFILDACKVIQDTPRGALELRSEALSNTLAHTTIRQGAELAASLKKKREQLQENFSLNALPEEVEILRHISQLISANLFSFLNADYKQAKRFYLTICKHKWMGNETAVSELRKLLDFIAQSKDFSDMTVLRDLLGSHFNGIDTQFEPFVALAGFYQDLSQFLSSPDASLLKEHIRVAPISVILAFPRCEVLKAHESISQNTTLNSLNNLIEHHEAQLNALEANATQIQQYAALFHNPKLVLLDGMSALVEQVKQLAALWAELASNNTVKDMLGEAFLGAETQNENLERALAIAEIASHLDSDLRDILLHILENRQIERLIEFKSTIENKTKEQIEALEKLIQRAQILPEDKPQFCALYIGYETLYEAAEDKTGLEAFRNLAWIKQELTDLGFAFLIDDLEYLAASNHGLGDIAEALVYRAMFKEICDRQGNFVTKFSGERLNDLRKRIANTDKELVNLSRLKLKSQLISAAKAPEGVNKGRKCDFTELALLKNEAMKKARIIPVRAITHRAGKALQEIKPCWMMSPLTVAQYIPKGVIEFDLVIIDEASQMTPENAIGAICRGKQVMVVGDTNQLPPSNFFGKMFAPQDNADEDEGVVDESILEMANKVFLPARRLSWHYRSRHESLIAFSNRYVYNNKLVIFPSPSQNTSLYGVSQVYVPGEYSSSINRIEAREMIQAVLNFIQEHPDLSLGVVVMNQKQKDLMEQEWSFALNQNPEAKEYISHWSKKEGGLEKFFIKNLENVQGDERDVIFIGTVYGPEQAGGPVMQRFGPINGTAGKRRLNVLFSRAKQQIITFTSMKPQDVIADESKPGPYMLKKWLEFTTNQGNFSLGEATHRPPDSEFEECVIAAVEQLGCIAVPQVGVSGYFIDIGVKHPNWENDFLFGIECDGASYHSSKSARDRDRLRQEVLESKGWTLHRIWSTDWFSDPKREALRLEDTLKQLLLGRH